MTKVTFVTGNQGKADYLAKYLGCEVAHRKLDLDEIQSLDLKKIVEHKVRQAYDLVQLPVIVEDVSLEFEALGGLPGPFVKYFVERVPLEVVCGMVGNGSRNATARCVFGYFDGERLELFEGSMKGELANAPEGENGFGWDRVFIPEGYLITRSQMTDEDYRQTYMQIKPFDQLKQYLDGMSLI